MMLGCTRCTLGVQAVTGVAYMTRICQKWGGARIFTPPPLALPRRACAPTPQGGEAGMMVLMMHAPPSVRTRARRVADGIGAGGESPPLHSPFPRDAALSLSLSLLLG